MQQALFVNVAMAFSTPPIFSTLAMVVAHHARQGRGHRARAE